MRPPGARRVLPVLAIALLTAALPAAATSPCGPNTWIANERRTSDEWRKLARWIFVGRLVARDEQSVPYANCYLPDMRQCSREDVSTLTFAEIKWEKGAAPPGHRLLQAGAAACGPTPPRAIGTLYRVYGSYTPSGGKPVAYDFIEPAKR